MIRGGVHAEAAQTLDQPPPPWKLQPATMTCYAMEAPTSEPVTSATAQRLHRFHPRSSRALPVLAPCRGQRRSRSSTQSSLCTDRRASISAHCSRGSCSLSSSTFWDWRAFYPPHPPCLRQVHRRRAVLCTSGRRSVCSGLARTRCVLCTCLISHRRQALPLSSVTQLLSHPRLPSPAPLPSTFAKPCSSAIHLCQGLLLCHPPLPSPAPLPSTLAKPNSCQALLSPQTGDARGGRGRRTAQSHRRGHRRLRDDGGRTHCPRICGGARPRTSHRRSSGGNAPREHPRSRRRASPPPPRHSETERRGSTLVRV